MSVSRYKVLARRNKYEPWTAWTDANNYQRAKEHAAKTEIAREIFAELDEFIVTRVCYVYGQAYDISDKYVELKRKYTEEKV